MTAFLNPTTAVILVALLALGLILAILFRRVVSTNTVHIVQRGRATMPYGTGPFRR